MVVVITVVVVMRPRGRFDVVEDWGIRPGDYDDIAEEDESWRDNYYDEDEMAQMG